MGPPFPRALFLFVWLQCSLFAHIAGTVMTDAVLSTTVNVVDEGTMEVSPRAAFDLMVLEERYYAGFGPGQWMLAVPFYVALRPALERLPGAEGTGFLGNPYSYERPKELPGKVLYLQVALVWLFLGPLTGWFFARFHQSLARRLPPWAALAVTLACASGSVVTVFSCVYSKQWLATLLLGAVVLRHLDDEGPLAPRRALVSGLLAGLAVTVDYMAVFGAALVAVWLLVRVRSVRALVPFAAGAGLFAVFLMAYHAWFLGSPFETPYDHRTWYEEEIPFRYRGRLWRTSEILDKERVVGVNALPSAEAVVGLSVSRFKGLFFFSSFLVLGLVGHAAGVLRGRGRATALLGLGTFGVYFWLNASLNGEPYWSGWPPFFGPRYLLYTVPLLALGVGGLDLRRRGWAVALGVTAAVSVGIHLVGLMYQDLNMWERMDAPRVLDPVPGLLGRLFTEGPRIPLLAPGQPPSGPLHAVAVALFLVALGLTVRATLRPRS